jgi:hypothetical protein
MHPYYIERDIKRAWVLALILATGTLAISLFVVLARSTFYGISAWTLFDAALMYGLAIGVYRRSRVTIVLLICYLAESKLHLYWVTGKIGALISLAIFGYFFLTGALAIFEYHRQRPKV